MISVTYQELDNVREELLRLDNAFQNQVNELENFESALTSMWEGPTRKAFHFAFQQDLLFFHGFYDLIQSYARILEVVAANYRKADVYKGGLLNFDIGDLLSGFKKGIEQLHNTFNEIQSGIEQMKSTFSEWTDKIKNFNPLEAIKESGPFQDMMRGIEDLKIKATDTLEDMQNKVKDYFDDIFDDGLFPDGMWHIPSKEDHYNRNDHNMIPDNNHLDEVYTVNDKGEIEPQEGWRLLSEGQSKYHMQPSPYQPEGDERYNKKFVNENGSEIIICVPPEETGTAPYIVSDEVNGGTYNYSDPNWSEPSSIIGHFFNDMIPYYLWGNTPADSGWLT